MTSRNIVLALVGIAAVAVSAASGGVAGAAPAAQAQVRSAPPAEAARRCTIGSFEGVLIPGTQVCTRISGFVRVEIRSGRRGSSRH